MRNDRELYDKPMPASIDVQCDGPVGRAQIQASNMVTKIFYSGGSSEAIATSYSGMEDDINKLLLTLLTRQTGARMPLRGRRRNIYQRYRPIHQTLLSYRVDRLRSIEESNYSFYGQQASECRVLY